VSHRRLHVAVFGNDADLLAAARECARSGCAVVDAYTPHAVHGLDAVMGIRRSRLPWATLVGGVLGMAGGLALQYWTSAADWPLDVGGKPLDSFVAFVPVAFELTVLCAGLATVAGILLRSGLLPGRRPARRIDRTTDDRFALVVAGGGGAIAHGALAAIFAAHGAVQVLEEAP
jgi:hypothetical protein